MAQTWILRADMSPMDALRTGGDSAICGACPLRGFVDPITGKRVGRICYVNVGQAPMSIWNAFQRGAYPDRTPDDVARMLSGRAVRLGAYGDPAMIPLAILETLVSRARLWTGYTHQWRNVDPRYARLLMASADSVADRKAARAMGWRSFYVVPMASGAPVRAMECASTRDRNPLSCADCGACAGTRKDGATGAVDVYIRAHGSGAKYVTGKGE